MENTEAVREYEAKPGVEIVRAKAEKDGDGNTAFVHTWASGTGREVVTALAAIIGDWVSNIADATEADAGIEAVAFMAYLQQRVADALLARKGAAD